MREMLLMGIVGAGTLGMRSAFMVGSARLPASLERVMRHAKPAILAALVGSFLVGEGGISVEGVAALAAAWLVSLRGGGMLAMLSVGMLVAVAIPG